MRLKIIIAPDKFKDSLTSMEVCLAIRKGIKRADANAQVLQYPMADGGDGFATVMKHYLGSMEMNVESVDPLGRKMDSTYLWSPHNQTAIIELATCSGLSLLSENERTPMTTSTYGTGIQVMHAIEQGAKRIILGLGGSATHDAGMGILRAMGFRFLNDRNETVRACGEELIHIRNIEPPPEIPPVIFEIAADVTNTLYGKNGAAYVYSPQKGASPEQVRLLDNGLIHFASILRKKTGKSVATIPGTGAAGGIAAGLLGYFNTTIKKGIDLVFQASGISSIMQDADLVITGEGKIDEQTLQGKTAAAIARLAQQNKIPCIGFCGICELPESKAKKLFSRAVIEIGKGLSKPESIRKAASLLEVEAYRLIIVMNSKTG